MEAIGVDDDGGRRIVFRKLSWLDKITESLYRKSLSVLLRAGQSGGRPTCAVVDGSPELIAQAAKQKLLDFGAEALSL